MINMRPIIVEALELNRALILLLRNEPRIYNNNAPNADEFPRITFFELLNGDNDYFDNQATASDISFQIDIWHKEGTSEIAKEVDKTMKSIGFNRYAIADLYEEGTEIFHYAMRFKTKVEHKGGII